MQLHPRHPLAMLLGDFCNQLHVIFFLNGCMNPSPSSPSPSWKMVVAFFRAHKNKAETISLMGIKPMHAKTAIKSSNSNHKCHGFLQVALDVIELGRY